MNEETLAVMIPMVCVIVIGLVVWAFFVYRHRTRARVQETIQAALERGAELTPELIDRMAGPQVGPDRDLRRGIVLIAIGLGFGLFGIAIGEEEAIGPLLGIGLFPFLVGLAYLLMYRLGKRES